MKWQEDLMEIMKAGGFNKSDSFLFYMFARVTYLYLYLYPFLYLYASKISLSVLILLISAGETAAMTADGVVSVHTDPRGQT